MNRGNAGGRVGRILPGALALALVTASDAKPAAAQDPGHYAVFEGASADGARVFFETTEPLVAADRDNRLDVYERFAGRTVRVSSGRINGNGTFGAFFAGSSDDGARVFFETSERLAPQDSDTQVDVYQRASGQTTLVSAGVPHGGVDGDSSFTGASASGSRVFLHSAERLVAADTDELLDVYERSGGTTKLLSTGAIGGSGEAGAEFAGASTDGARVFIETNERLEASDTDDLPDVYERSGGATRLVSIGLTTSDASLPPSLFGASGDGTRAFFFTNERLLGADTDAAVDLYERSGGSTKLASDGEINGDGEFTVSPRAISSDGTSAYFGTQEQLAVNDGDSQHDVYERSGGTTTLVSAGEINGDGRLDASFAGLATGDMRGPPAYFHTEEQLVAADSDQSRDVYERGSGETTLVSAGEINGNGEFNANFARASEDGSLVLFETSEQLVPADLDSAADIYQRSDGVTTLISGGRPGVVYDSFSFFGGASADAGRVFFTTDEPIAEADWDGVRDVYASAGGVTQLVSPETIPPQTWIKRGPIGRTREHRPRFRLRSSEPGSTYRCKIDGASFPCGRTARPGRLMTGLHTFRARAIDRSHNRDKSAARRRFRVVK